MASCQPSVYWPCRSETATVSLQLGFLVLDVRPTQEAAMKLLDLSPKHGYASSSVVDGDLECASGSPQAQPQPQPQLLSLDRS